jgi:hypothetical protein
MVWDPFGTLRRVLWIGGGQWVGKSTVPRLLAAHHEVTAYHYDYHDARGHNDRRIARWARRGEPPEAPGPEAVWVNTTRSIWLPTLSPAFPSGSNGSWTTFGRWSAAGRSSPKGGGCARIWSRRSSTRPAG